MEGMLKKKGQACKYLVTSPFLYPTFLWLNCGEEKNWFPHRCTNKLHCSAAEQGAVSVLKIEGVF